MLTNNNTMKEHEILDLETYDELQSILEDGFDDLLKDFIRDTPPTLNNLNQAISASDFELIFSVSHGLAGSAGNLGISHLSSLLSQIQQVAKSENIEDCIQLGKEVEVAFEEAKEALLEKMKQN